MRENDVPELLQDEDVGLDPATELSDKDVGLEPAGIKLSPYDQARMSGPMPRMGAFGPTATPEQAVGELKSAAGDLLRLPGKVVEPLTTAASDMMADWLRRTGINPAAEAGKEQFRVPFSTEIPGTQISPLRMISPGAAEGVEKTGSDVLSSFTEPGSMLMLGALAKAPGVINRAAGIIFGSDQLAGLPDELQESIKTLSDPKSTASEQTQALARPGVRALLAGTMLKHGLTRKGVPDAREVSKAAEIHGDVRPQPEPAVELPVPESGPRVQPQAEGRIQEAPVQAKVRPPTETIVAAAIKHGDTFAKGNAHDPIRNAMVKSGDADLIESAADPANEGFAVRGPDGKERWVPREEAAKIATAQGVNLEDATSMRSEDAKAAKLWDEKLPTELPKAAPKEVPAATETGTTPAPVAEEEHVGMGGATPEEVEPTGTALKNAVGELERVGLGLPEAYPTVRKNMGKAWIKSGEVESKAPGAGKKLADDLVANPERGMTDEDSALLLRHKVDLFNRMNDAAERTHTGDEASRKVAQKEHAALSEEYLNLLDAIKFRGSQWGREGRWRQALAKEDHDFSSSDEINRYHKTHTGEDLKPDEKVKAEKIAGGVKKAVNAEGEANQKLADHVRKKYGERTPDAEKDAWRAVWKTIREAAARMAAGVNRTRIEDAVREMETAAEQEGAAGKAMANAIEKAKDAAIKLAKADEAKGVAKVITEKATAKIQEKAAQRALDSARKTVRDAAARAAKAERVARENPDRAIWEKAKSYLDQGVDNFDDIRNRLATDFGMKVERVTKLLAQDERAKYLSDDLWRKQQDARRLKEQAKRWVQNLEIPLYKRAISSIPKILFSLKVGFHGTVALGTHAPFVAFQPRFWATYIRDFGKMYKMVANPAYYENQVQDLMRRPNYVKARRAGLVNDPFQFEDYNSPDTSKYFGNLAGMGNRGYAVLKILRQDMFDQMWNKLPKTTQIPEVAAALSDGINHATGVVKGKAPRGTNLALFAPRLEASRVMWLAGDPLKAADTLLHWKKSSLGDQQFALNQVKEKLWVVGTMFGALALNQGFLSATGSKQAINFDNPFKSDFLKFKAAGMDLAYGNAMLSMARLPLRLWVGIKNEGKLNKIIYEDENTAKTLFDYARSQASPFMGLMLDLAFGRDFQQRPLPAAGFGLLPERKTMPKRLKAQGLKAYSWPEFWAEQLTPIPFQEAIKEVWGKGLGMSDEQINHAVKALATIAVMGGTGARLVEEPVEKK